MRPLGRIWLLSEKVRTLKLRSIRRDPRKLKEARADFWGWLLGVSLFIVLATSLGLWWTYWTSLKFERDEVEKSLVLGVNLPVNGDPLKSNVTVRNGSSFDISDRHQIVCMINLVVNDSGYPLLEDLFSVQSDSGFLLGSPHKFDVVHRDSPLKSKNDSVTESCLNIVKGQRVKCADVVVDFAYYLTDQSNVQDHRERKVFLTDDGWNGQPLDSKKDYCSDSLSEDQKEARKEQMATSNVGFFANKEYWGPKQPQ
jgi:hypothetical protein